MGNLALANPSSIVRARQFWQYLLYRRG